MLTMATQKFSAAIVSGAPAEITTMTNMAVVGIIVSGPVKIEMKEPASGDYVPISNPTENRGAFDVRQVGTVLRLTNTGGAGAAASASVFEQ